MPDPRDKVLFSTPSTNCLYPDIEYEIESEGYQEGYSDGQPKISMYYRVRWADSAKWVASMLGVHGTSSTRASRVSRFPPAKFPDGDYDTANITSGFSTFPFLGWRATSVELVNANELSLQYQSTGFLQNALKPADALEADVDFDSVSGDMLNPGYDANGKPDGGVGGGFVTYRCTYEPVQYEIRTDEEIDLLPSPLCNNELGRYIIRTPRFSGKALTIPGGGLYYRDKLLAATDDAARRACMIPEGYPRVFGTGNLTYQWLFSPGIPWQAINSALGCVNAEENGDGEYKKFDYSPTRQGLALESGIVNGFEKHTLLFLGLQEARPIVTAAGQLLFHICYQFEYRPRNGTGGTGGHNEPFRVNPEGYARVVRGGTAFPNNVYDSNTANWRDLYDEYQFSRLFAL